MTAQLLLLWFEGQTHTGCKASVPGAGGPVTAPFICVGERRMAGGVRSREEAHEKSN